MTQEDANLLLPVLRELPPAFRDALLRYLYRLEGGEAVYDSMVEMQMELGTDKAEAHAIVDRLMARFVRH